MVIATQRTRNMYMDHQQNEMDRQKIHSKAMKLPISDLNAFMQKMDQWIIYRFNEYLDLLMADQYILKQISESKSMFDEPLQEKELHRQQHAPNNTIYISNLNEKVPIDELKDTLFNIFEEYGEIIDIIAKRNIRMRGQAFIIYKDINSAMEAKRKKNAKELFGKTMKIQFARQKSDAIAKIDGTFQIREKPQNYFQLKFKEKFVDRPQQIRVNVERQKNILKKVQTGHNPPNHILFLQGLDATISADILREVFGKYSGFVEVRTAPKNNFAFIQYEDEFKAGTALSALNQTQIGTVTLNISYAKK